MQRRRWVRGVERWGGGAGGGILVTSCGDDWTMTEMKGLIGSFSRKKCSFIVLPASFHVSSLGGDRSLVEGSVLPCSRLSHHVLNLM